MPLEELKTPWCGVIRKFDRTDTIVGLLGLTTSSNSRGISHEEASMFAKTQAMDFYHEADLNDSQDVLYDVYRKIAQALIERQGK